MPLVSFEPGAGAEAIRRGHLNLGGSGKAGERIVVNSFYLERNGQPWLAVMGEFHFSRYPQDQWDRELAKVKTGGVDIVAAYLFWNHHEEEEGCFNWRGNRDVRRFVQLCARHGLLVGLRIGPFAHGEVRNGGLPDWLYAKPFASRSNDPQYLALAQRLYEQIGRQVEGLMYRDGGPIVGIQLENEYASSAAPWETTQLPAMEFTPIGSGGAEHLLHLKRLAQEAGLDVPLFTATGWGNAPIVAEQMLPVFGGYAFHPWREESTPQAPTDCYIFKDMHRRKHERFDPATVPFACCEMGGGVQPFYKWRPIVPAASVEAMHVVYLGSGANLIGYYVYHGGSNPVGKLSFLNEHRCPRISYDFQAPIREFGQINESYHRLRRQFLFLRNWGAVLAPMATSLPEGQPPIDPIDTRAVRCAVRSKGYRGFVFFNNYQDHVESEPVGPVKISIKLSQGTMTFPHGDGFILEKEVCGIFPFHLDLDGVELAYATAQPLARVESADAAHYFFYAVRGIAPEFAFSASTVGQLAVKGSGPAPGVREGDRILMAVEPGLHSLIELTTRAGRRVLITTLTDEQSRQFWQGRLGGVQRVVISDTDISFYDGSLEIYSTGQRAASVRVYPDPGVALQAPAGVVAGELDGRYRHYRVILATGEPDCRVQIVSPGRAVVRIEPNAWQDFDEILVRIDYVGDVGTAWVDGRLIHDNFSNGTVWELGLRRFLKAGMASDVLIRIGPRRGEGADTGVPSTAMAAIQPADDPDAIAEIRSITVVGCRYVPLTIPVAAEAGHS